MAQKFLPDDRKLSDYEGKCIYESEIDKSELDISNFLY